MTKKPKVSDTWKTELASPSGQGYSEAGRHIHRDPVFCSNSSALWFLLFSSKTIVLQPQLHCTKVDCYLLVQMCTDSVRHSHSTPCFLCREMAGSSLYELWQVGFNSSFHIWTILRSKQSKVRSMKLNLWSICKNSLWIK